MKINIELHDETLLHIGERAIIDFYQTLAIDKRTFPKAIAFATGVKSPVLNVLFDLRLERKNSAELVEAASAFFNNYQVPWGWFITVSNENDLVQQGFSLLEEVPAMYFNLSNPLPDMKSDLTTIVKADNTDNLKSWIQPINEGFGVEEGDENYRKLNAQILQKGENKLGHFTAYYKGEIAAAGTLFLSKEAVMIHNLATKTNFQKLGLGTALTLHMMAIAKQLGFLHCFLDSSEEAFSLYQKIGFKTYHSTSIYCKNM